VRDVERGAHGVIRVHGSELPARGEGLDRLAVVLAYLAGVSGQ